MSPLIRNVAYVLTLKVIVNKLLFLLYLYPGYGFLQDYMRNFQFFTNVNNLLLI